MYPGLSEADCHVAQVRYQELHATAKGQRRAASAALVPSGRVGVMETMQRRISALVEPGSQLLQRVRTQKTRDHTAAPGTLALSE